MKKWMTLLAASGLLSLTACTHHTVHIDPIEVKPMTLNINIRVQKDLDQFFDFDKPATEGDSAQPVSKANEGAKP